MFSDLNKDNVLIYAVKAYDKLNYVKSEFNEDYRTFNYIRRIFQKYRETGEIKCNLLLNHLSLVYNVFGVEAGTRILFYKVEELDYSTLKTFLVFLNTMPDTVTGIRGNDIHSGDLSVDMTIANVLRKI